MNTTYLNHLAQPSGGALDARNGDLANHSLPSCVPDYIHQQRTERFPQPIGKYNKIKLTTEGDPELKSRESDCIYRGLSTTRHLASKHGVNENCAGSEHVRKLNQAFYDVEACALTWLGRELPIASERYLIYDFLYVDRNKWRDRRSAEWNKLYCEIDAIVTSKGIPDICVEIKCGFKHGKRVNEARKQLELRVGLLSRQFNQMRPLIIFVDLKNDTRTPDPIGIIDQNFRFDRERLSSHLENVFVSKTDRQLNIPIISIPLARLLPLVAFMGRPINGESMGALNQERENRGLARLLF